MHTISDFAPNRRLDIIWNHTALCPHDCADCCVDAAYVKGDGEEVVLRTANLARVERMQVGSDNKYTVAQHHQQQMRRELMYEQKLQVLNNLKGFDVRIDLSGGDALVTPDGLPLLKACAAAFGQDNVTLTVTGAGLRRSDMAEVATQISELNFTFNSAEPADAVSRPEHYASSNLTMASRMAALGVPVRAECPLVKGNCHLEHLDRLYMQLHHAGIQRLLLMRQFPVGRGNHSPYLVPTREEYLVAIRHLFELEAKHGSVAIKLQCALRHLAQLEGLLPSHALNPCDAVRESYGLMPDGTLLASPWAINGVGQPLDPAWVLGNLCETPLIQILQRSNAQTMMYRADENWGHCKIFSFLYSQKTEFVDRMHDLTDPLLTDPSSDQTKVRTFWMRES